jgi:hypothetical protein
MVHEARSGPPDLTDPHPLKWIIEFLSRLECNFDIHVARSADKAQRVSVLHEARKRFKKTEERPQLGELRRPRP